MIRLGIGDVVKGIPRPIVDAMKNAMEEMAHDESFQGYPPDQGQEWLRQAIVDNDFASRGVQIDISEVFVSDGAKCDSGNIQEIFGPHCTVALTDPVYPVSAIATSWPAARERPKTVAMRGWYICPAPLKNDFMPPLPEESVDVIYLCSPNNPTGTVMTREDLAQWIDYAKREKAIILFDSAYEGYITDESIPHSIYEVEGGREVAIEFRSYSKNKVSPVFAAATRWFLRSCRAIRKPVRRSTHRLWARRHSTKFNGVAYPVQRGAEAAYSPEGQKAIREIIAFYQKTHLLCATSWKPPVFRSTEAFTLPISG